MIFLKDIETEAARRANTTRSLARDVLAAAVQVLTESLCSGTAVAVHDLGVFTVKTFPAHTQKCWGRKLPLPDQSRVRFRAYDSLKQKVREARDA